MNVINVPTTYKRGLFCITLIYTVLLYYSLVLLPTIFIIFILENWSTITLVRKAIALSETIGPLSYLASITGEPTALQPVGHGLVRYAARSEGISLDTYSLGELCSFLLTTER